MKKIIETSARLTLAAALCFGCSRAPNGPSSAESAPAHAEAPGSAKLAPGMCAEHGVLEAVCTKCNPALAAVFKAKGDWCSEHGFPESFCPVCRPEAGGRPATELASDDGPLDGTKVRLATPEAIRAADLRTEVATEAGGERILVVPARIVYDATRVAVVNARAEGVVERLVADVGTQVRRGAALAVLRSAGLGAERSKLQAAQSRLGVAEAALRRVEALHADGIAPERDLLEARREVEAARAEVDASRASLGMVGAPSDEAGTYELRAPLAGVVTKRSASVGQLVGAESSLFEIVDPSK
ncbi:efflux RND transporter periplasmic adaptor subunit, partial [Myxococcota bacterium]|nr:efflux RND transporter periplasmic adaptor subunit [Myxococcota bacterium]